MRLHDLFLLKEYDDSEQEKSKVLYHAILTQVDNEEDAKLLDRIYKVLNGHKIGQNI